MEAEEGGVLVKGRAVIDTRPPFRSVKEAVALFGERVLVGEIYAKQLNEMESKVATLQKPPNNSSTLVAVSSELEETKKKLQKEREEGNHITTCIKSLKDVLEQTKRELLHLKTLKNASIHHPKMINPEIEELNFVEKSISKPDFEDDHRVHQHDYQKKKFVSFASPPSLTREIIHDNVDDGSFVMLERTPSFRKESKERKKKNILPIMGWIFPRKKNYEGDSKSSPRI